MGVDEFFDFTMEEFREVISFLIQQREALRDEEHTCATRMVEGVVILRLLQRLSIPTCETSRGTSTPRNLTRTPSWLLRGILGIDSNSRGDY